MSVLAALLCEDGPRRLREMDDWKVGWAREDGHIKQAQAPGHDRPALRLCRFPLYRTRGIAHPARAVEHGKRDSPHRRTCDRRYRGSQRRSLRRDRAASADRATRHARRQSGGHRHWWTDRALSPQQRIVQHGRRRLRAGAARRRRTDRHGIRAVLSDRPSRATAGRDGPDHVGSVPLQARRQTAQCRDAGIRGRLRDAGQSQRRPLRADAGSGDLCHHAGSRGRPRQSCRRRLSELSARAGGRDPRRVRAGGGPAGRKTASIWPNARSRSRRSRITIWGGVRVDATLQTRVPGLYACGEAVGGANGANRLSGNAITEALVFGASAGRNAPGARCRDYSYGRRRPPIPRSICYAARNGATPPIRRRWSPN